jgi:predicted transcriptional regulator
MTRHPSPIQDLADTSEASLPTSRAARGQELGIFAMLRALAPRRPLSLTETTLIAELQASRLLKLAKLDTPPTPSALIAELPRVLVRTDPDLPASGATHWVNGRWLLLINSSEPAARQRFSLCHEYKHALDHRHRTVMYEDTADYSADEQAELAADAFAAALLMPAIWVNKAWREGHRRLSELAELFEVSPRAMARRLDALGLRRLEGSRNGMEEAAA